MKRDARSAFSLVEIVLAIGIIGFALVTIMALLPVGAGSNQDSAEATRAAGILTLLEADLRNTHPFSNNGKSRLFGLPLPYAVVAGNVALNSSLPTNVAETAGLDDAENPVPSPVTGLTPYQASVIYTQVPTNASGPAPILARLVVGWPARSGATVTDLTDASKIRGYVETCTSFPAP
ncbi:MAG: hypothetical protein WC003_07875 [Terrimicrobiaceae bacterium]